MSGNPPAVAIAVPVRNEAERLPRLLLALARQREAPPFTLCLFFDGCTDGSHAVADALAPMLPFRIVDATSPRVPLPPNAGRARAAAGALALARSPSHALLSTDADSEPASDWIAANLRALDHAEVVAGRILIGDPGQSPLQSRLVRYYDALHRRRRMLDPVPWEDGSTHHWTSAASLALRPEAYRTLGGFQPLARGEDADLADRAWRGGLRLRRDARVAVRTSSRRRGRVEGGFAAMLAALDRAAALPRVSHPEDEAWRYRHHALARAAFERGEVCGLAGPLRLDAADLDRVAVEVPGADAFAARVVGAPPGGMRQVSLAHAEIALGALGDDRLEGAA